MRLWINLQLGKRQLIDWLKVQQGVFCAAQHKFMQYRRVCVNAETHVSLGDCHGLHFIGVSILGTARIAIPGAREIFLFVAVDAIIKAVQIHHLLWVKPHRQHVAHTHFCTVSDDIRIGQRSGRIVNEKFFWRDRLNAKLAAR